MRNDVIAGVVAVVLLVVCCAGPILLAGIGASAALAVVHAQPAIIVAPLAIVALSAAGLLFRARRLRTRGVFSREKR